MVKHVIKIIGWESPSSKNREDAQIEEIDEIIDECLAKIATYLT
ncbi:hypothetical protein GBL_3062 [Geobacillus kaustophilus GBlys]|uniref:Uncharacterized protein n=1 Tax=Geobacillus kaustophilus GBlys TaxID=1337888 RepID=U2X7C6_GEOKU|nr:hypothetical protein GBL_3062 [Geobacillus kaustophilus GBlys]